MNWCGTPFGTMKTSPLASRCELPPRIERPRISPALPANREVVVRASVSALGQGADTEVIFKLLGELRVETERRA